MRPHLPRPPTAQQPVLTTGQCASDISIAEAFLGGAHPLVAALRRLATAREQLISVSAVQAGAVVLWTGGWALGAAVAITAAACQLALGCRIAALRGKRNDARHRRRIGGSGVPGSVRFRSGNPRGFAVNAGLCGASLRARKTENGLFAGPFKPVQEARVLLAMQKVEGFESLQPLPMKPARRVGFRFWAHLR
jgi:hypothetical protein